MKTTFAKVMAVVRPLIVGCGQTMAMSKPARATGLKSTLNSLFQEHVYLAAAATGAALGGREAEFKAAAGVGSVYGTDAEQAFLPLWRKHIGYTKDFGAFLNAANPNLPSKVVARPPRTRPRPTQRFGRRPATCRPSPTRWPTRSLCSPRPLRELIQRVLYAPGPPPGGASASMAPW